ncbi:hypothetical protein SAMN05421877_101150 [Sphingobacterium lactis]|uniref:Uncharacterized protein n=1 Tax=Sphingobacterium lactis TaxID=797291 RepID=A0A1H5S2W9_9SPHI|nr:hypothetical protein SAMN05421877_101150 [Sphingobacterium lactis]
MPNSVPKIENHSPNCETIVSAEKSCRGTIQKKGQLMHRKIYNVLKVLRNNKLTSDPLSNLIPQMAGAFNIFD